MPLIANQEANNIDAVRVEISESLQLLSPAGNSATQQFLNQSAGNSPEICQLSDRDVSKLDSYAQL